MSAGETNAIFPGDKQRSGGSDGVSECVEERRGETGPQREGAQGAPAELESMQEGKGTEPTQSESGAGSDRAHSAQF